MIVNEHLQIDRETQTALADTIQFVGHSQEKSRTELRGVASQLDSLRRFHFQVLQDLPLGVVSLDEAGIIISWNKQLSKLTGINQHYVIGRTIGQLEALWQELLAGFIASEEFFISKLKVPVENETRVLNLFKAVVSQERENEGGLAILIEDHSDRYSLEEKLVHSERLASIGQLATGVAHEIGNPVTGIACLAQDLRVDLEHTPRAQEGLHQILTQTDRISQIVGSLSNFGHAGVSEEYPAENLHLHYVIHEAIQLVSLSHAGKQMQYENRCGKDIMVTGFTQKLIQVFVNLLTNATDASQPGQPITIDSKVRGTQVVISVEDQGKGIAEEHLSKIFEPFFTTKMVGEGTGLGLSLTYRIIQQHGGSISVASSTGGGCRIDIVLPGADESVAAQA
jgi:PAS domain S-box-containing protein